MSKIEELPKGQVKKNGNFYGWAFIGVMFAVMGIFAIVDRRFQYRSGTPPLEGDLAVCVGLIFLLYGIFSIYHLIFKAEKKELEHSDFHVLKDFEDFIEGHKTKFEVSYDATLSGNNSSVRVCYYKLSITLSKNLYVNLRIKQRDRIEYILWNIGITRRWDVLTGNPYFDSKYYVQCSNKALFTSIFDNYVIELLEKFDRDYPPIRDKNGILIITDSCLHYIEGPYNEYHRLFDPHRGRVKELFEELIKITVQIEKNVPENLSESEKQEIILLKEQIEKHNKRKKQKRELLLRVYRGIMYVVCTLLILFSVLSHST